MPRIAFKVFLLIVANAFYIVMGILEEQYYEPMASKNAVNKFCTNHDVVKIETTQNNDEDLVTVVTYKEQLNDN